MQLTINEKENLAQLKNLIAGRNDGRYPTLVKVSTAGGGSFRRANVIEIGKNFALTHYGSFLVRPNHSDNWRHLKIKDEHSEQEHANYQSLIREINAMLYPHHHHQQ